MIHNYTKCDIIHAMEDHSYKNNFKKLLVAVSFDNIANDLSTSAPKGRRTHYVSICKFFVGLSSLIITLISLFCISADNNMLTFQLIFIAASVIAISTLLFFILAFLRKSNKIYDGQ